MNNKVTNITIEEEKEILASTIETCATDTKNVKLLLEIIAECLEDIQSCILRLKDNGKYPKHWEFEKIDKSYRRAQELGYIAADKIDKIPNILYDLFEKMD